MKFLTVEYIKEHSRIDYDCEDALLDLYGTAAEDTVLNICNRSYDSLIEEYGGVPAAIIQAALMLVDNGYANRTPASPQSLYAVPYSFDMLVKPYCVLHDEVAAAQRQTGQ